MISVSIYFLSLLLLVGFGQIDGKEETISVEDYSKMSVTELNTAFILAVQNRRIEMMQELLQAGANVNTPIRYTWTSGDCDWTIESKALIYAIRHNYPDMVKVLVSLESKLNEALDLAIDEGYATAVEELVKGGADLNYAKENGDTPLIVAVEHARATAEFGLQAHEQQRSRWQSRRAIIEILLKGGAKVSHTNKDGETALMKAVKEHDLYTVEILLQVPEMTRGSYFDFGTKPINYADKDGNTALILAIKKVQYTYINSQQCSICKNSQKIIQVLLETPGIDLHHVNNNGETAITLFKKLNEKLNKYPR
ncbi:MAG: ankyrin repeat domain-containing protein [Candidatus Methylopumilus universalis]